jgi:hypothetical protein
VWRENREQNNERSQGEGKRNWKRMRTVKVAEG